MSTRARAERTFEWLWAQFEVPAEARLLAVFRIAYALLSVWLARKCWLYVDLMWGSMPVEARGELVLLHGGWVLLALLLLVGIGDRWTAFLHWATSAALLFGDDIGSTVNDEIFLVSGFFLIFIGTNSMGSLDAVLHRKLAWWPRPAAPRALPVYLFGVTVGSKITTAGVTKLFDPFWYAGSGFYMTWEIPWIKPVWVAPLADWQWLMWLLNYAGMGMELAFLPLFLVRRTRWIAVTLLAMFFAQLCFPLRIDLIGPLGLVECIGLSALFGARRPLAEPRTSLPPLRANLPAYAGFAACLALAAQVFFYTALAFTGTRYYWEHSLPPVALEDPTQYRVESSPLLRRLSTPMNDWTARLRHHLWPWEIINRNTTQIWSVKLFTQVHFFGIYAHRVVLEPDSDEPLEPVRVFLEDKTAGPYCRGIGEPRFFQRLMYQTTTLARKLQRGEEPSPRLAQACQSLIDYSIRSLPESRAGSIRSANVLVSPIVMPTKFEGDARPWVDTPWQPLCLWRRGEGLAFATPDPYPYRLPEVRPRRPEASVLVRTDASEDRRGAAGLTEIRAASAPEPSRE